MIGGNLSRWTMSYFAAAIAWLVGAEALMAAGFGFPSGGPCLAGHPRSGAHDLHRLAQHGDVRGAAASSLPVLVSGPLYAENWALPAFVLLTAGLITLLSGFLALGGRLPPWLWLLPVGAGLLVAGFGLIAVDLALTVWRVRSPGGPARFVLVGIASLCATAGLGTSFAWKLAGHGGPALDSLLQFGVPLHAIAGLGGWLTITAMGVGLSFAFHVHAVSGHRRSQKHDYAPCRGGRDRHRHSRRLGSDRLRDGARGRAPIGHRARPCRARALRPQ